MSSPFANGSRPAAAPMPNRNGNGKAKLNKVE